MKTIRKQIKAASREDKIETLEGDEIPSIES